MDKAGLRVISSLSHRDVKLARSLQLRKHRDSKGLFLVDGVKLIEEALKRKVSLTRVFFAQEILFGGTDSGGVHERSRARALLDLLEEKGIPVSQVSPKVLSSIASTTTPQGIVAIARKRELPVPAVHLPLYLLLFEVQDPGNLGGIVRSCLASGVTALVVSRSVDLYNPKVVRGSMGGIFLLPVRQVEDFRKEVQTLKERGMKIVSTSPSSRAPYFSEDFSLPLAFLLGNEGRGLPEWVRQFADAEVGIPMTEKVESLNVAVTAALLCYEAVRQRSS